MFLSATAILKIVLFCAQTIVVTAADNRKEDTIFVRDRVGGLTGKWFDDGAFPRTNHKRIASIHMTSCDEENHITKLDVGYRDNSLDKGPIEWTRHGDFTGSLQAVVLDLDKTEYITKVVMYDYMARTGRTWPHKYKVRIGSVHLWTSKGQHVACGAWNNNDGTHTDEAVSTALLYFSGSSGDAIDSLQTHWIPAWDF